MATEEISFSPNMPDAFIGTAEIEIGPTSTDEESEESTKFSGEDDEFSHHRQHHRDVITTLL